jgi:Tfp pilus assembly protein PilO
MKEYAMSESIYLLTIFVPLGTILLVFGMKYFTAFHQARARLGEDQIYRQMAEKSATAQSETAAVLISIQEALAELRTQMASAEKVLKDVE